MKTYIDCLPCFLRQATEAARFATGDPSKHHEILRKTLLEAADFDFNSSPPEMAKRIHRIVRGVTKQDDPYHLVKKKYNQWAMEQLPVLRKKVKDSKNPLEVALQLAIAGNIIDFGINGDLHTDEIVKTIESALACKLDAEAVQQFEKEVTDAHKILYLTDNAGEIVFDRLLIEQLPARKITVAVKASPIINDATMEDAEFTGLTKLVEVIDNGSDAPGTILRDCSEQFKKRFSEADLVISKGQGNYETLCNSNKNIFYILKIKCKVLARSLNAEIGTLILKNTKSLSIKEVT